MLYIQNGEVWFPREPDVLAKEITLGIVDRSTPARSNDRGKGECSLEQVLDQEDYQALSRALLRAVFAIYEDDPDGLDLASLERRVVELGEWTVSEPGGRRFHLHRSCLSALLAELRGFHEEALRRYHAFLALEPDREEPGLTLVARNNAAVLQLRQGRLDGLSDLVRAAVVNRLPGASFNLLVLLIKTWSQGTLSQIDPYVMAVLTGLDPSERTTWIGPDPQSEVGGEGSPVARTLCAEPEALRQLINGLLHVAIHIKPLDDVSAELGLWPVVPAPLVAGLARGGPLPPACHAGLAEAVTLLFVRDIPDHLGQTFSHVTPVEDLAERQITLARTCLANDEFEPARAALRTARSLLPVSVGNPRVKWLRTDLDRLQVDLDRRETNTRSSQFFAALTDLTEQVEQICRLESQTEVRCRRILLDGSFSEVHALQAAVIPDEEMDCTRVLADRLDEHLRRLEARDRAADLQGHYKILQTLLPTDLDAPVGHEAYERLKLCRSLDPEGQVQDWAEIRRALGQHDARHFSRQAYLHSCDPNGRDRDVIETLLREALACDPSYAASAAPLVALLCLPDREGAPESFDQLRTSLLDQAKHLVEQQVRGADPLAPPGLQQDVVSEAVDCVRRIGNLLRRDGDLCTLKAMARSLWETFRPVLRRGTVVEIESVERILDEWVSVCPDRIDPRHPGNAALHDVKVSKLIARARQLLEAGQTDEAEGREVVLSMVAEAFRLGLCDREQAQSAVWLHAMSRPFKGTSSQQATLLDALDSRLAGLAATAAGELTVETIEGWIGEIGSGNSPA